MLGVIEGFYGEPWDEAARLDLFPSLRDWGYGFYIYAPKADPCLRRGWREATPAAARSRLERIGEAARECGLSWGVGLSPVGLAGAEPAARDRLVERVRGFGGSGMDILAMLFDDMPAAVPDLAAKQADLVARAADAFDGEWVAMCPSYYSTDPRLDRQLGVRPAGYLETLGRLLDPAVQVFWTGPRVCSREYPREHLDAVAEQLRRPPLIWDNYPVNDGPGMCAYLHLRAFSHRGPEVRARVAGIAVNPMNQCHLSRLALRTLPWNLGRPGYDAGAATSEACRALFPPGLAVLLLRDLERFQDEGLDTIDPETRKALAAEYAAVDHPAAREVVHWLEGRSRVGPEVVELENAP